MNRILLAVLGTSSLLANAGSAQPDLVVRTVELVPVTTTVQSVILYGLRATVENVGTAPTPSGAVIGVSFWVTGRIQSWHDLTLGPLNPGQTILVAPNEGPAGTGTDWSLFPVGFPAEIRAWVDDIDRIAELNENNNQRAFTYLPKGGDSLGGVGGGYDLTIWRFLTDPEQPRAGESFRVGAEILNLGDQATPAGVAHVVDFDVGGAEVRATGFRGPLAGGASIVVFADSPIALNPEIYGARIEARIDPGNLLTDEVNRNNNHFFRMTHRSGFYNNELIFFTEARPDLIVTDAKIVPSDISGLNTFEAKVKNIGAGLAQGILGVSWWINGTQMAWFDLPSEPLNPGQERTVRASGGPSGADARFTRLPQAGTEIRLRATVDDVHRIAESNEGNNEFEIVLTTPPELALPRISQHPVSRTVVQGESVSFAVTAEGAAPLAYQWRRSGAAIPGANGATYTIASVTLDDTGTYDCVISNPAGTVTSQSALLLVALAQRSPSIDRNPTDQVVPLGAPAIFSVDAGRSESVRFQWERNGRPIPGATRNAYSIPSVQPADAGLYRVVVSDSLGSVSSRLAILGVSTGGKFSGAAHSPAEFQNIRHPNGNVYDQVLLTGAAATVTADPGQVTRIYKSRHRPGRILRLGQPYRDPGKSQWAISA